MENENKEVTNTTTEVKEEVKPVEAPKKEEPVVPKKKSYKGAIFLTFLLLVLIVVLIMILMYENRLKNVEKGVTDLDTLVIPDKKKDALFDSKEVINKLDPATQEAVYNYLIGDTSSSFIEFLKKQTNDTKLYLADIFSQNSVTLDTLKTNLIGKYGTDLDIEGKNLVDLKNNSKILYSFNSTRVMFEKNGNLDNVDYKPFKNNGELLVLEYDDPVGTKEEYTITIYSAFLIRNGEKETIKNKKDNLRFDSSLSIDQIKENIFTYYSDHKEAFDKITYKFKLNNKKYNLIDVSIN